MTNDENTLQLGEPHPSAYIALDFIKSIPFKDLMLYQEALASTALSGNRDAAISSETLRRWFHHEPVSDRYIMGLAWMLWGLRNEAK